MMLDLESVLKESFEQHFMRAPTIQNHLFFVAEMFCLKLSLHIFVLHN